jgi:hypothetical protein
MLPDAVVTGTIHVGGKKIVAEGCPGYGDRVFSDVLPPLVPITDLFWGRITGDGRAACFTVAEATRGAGRWSRLMLALPEGTREFAPVTLRVTEWEDRARERHPRRYQVESTYAAWRVAIDVEHTQVAVESSYPGSAAGVRAFAPLIRLLSRRPRGTKFFGRATLEIERAGCTIREQALIIDEHVRFGPRRTHVQAATGT